MGGMRPLDPFEEDNPTPMFRCRTVGVVVYIDGKKVATSTRILETFPRSVDLIQLDNCFQELRDEVHRYYEERWGVPRDSIR